ncbi:MAG: alkaline phosphatase family protein [Streptosporangiaceae bacterium]
MRSPRLAVAVGAVLLAIVGCSSAAQPAGGQPGRTAAPVPASTAPAATTAPASDVPQPAPTVVVVFENRAFGQVIGSPDAPFLTELAHRGALFTHSYAITHPSEPNYLALFSGSTQGVTSDACPISFAAPNLASGLLATGKTFIGYAEDLPGIGSQACSAGEYARRHVPWADFRNLPPSVSQPFSGFALAGFSRLPTVAFVIPDLCNDMHDCSVSTGDAWLRAHLGGYATWAMTHDSLLIVTFDEDDGTQVNQIPTIFVGQQVRPGSYPERINHYTVLATIEAAYGLPRDGNAATAPPISDIWRRS